MHSYSDYSRGKYTFELLAEFLRSRNTEQPSCTTLDLSDNELKSIPIDILAQQFPNLKKLILYGNPFNAKLLLFELQKLKQNICVHLSKDVLSQNEIDSLHSIEINTNERNINLYARIDGTFKPVLNKYKQSMITGEVLLVVGESVEVPNLLILTTTGVFAIGSNQHFKLGLPDNNTPVHVPQKVTFPTDTEIVYVSTFSQASMFVSSMLVEYFLPLGSGDLFVSGTNSFGQLGLSRERSEIEGPELIPRSLYNNENALVTKNGIYHSVVLTKENGLYINGYDYFGAQQWPLTFYKVNHEQSIIYRSPIASIDSGSCHYAVLLNDGSAYASGSNNFGQLGSTDTNPDYRPLLPCDYFAEPVRITKIFCDGFHTRYIDSLGNLYCNSETKFGDFCPKQKHIAMNQQLMLGFKIESVGLNLAYSDAHELYDISGNHIHYPKFPPTKRKLNEDMHRCISQGMTLKFGHRSDYVYFVNEKSTMGKCFPTMWSEKNNLLSDVDILILNQAREYI